MHPLTSKTNKLRKLVILIIVGLNACTQNGLSEKIIETYDDGSVKIKNIFTNSGDSSRYVQLYYLRDGRVIDSSFINEGKIEGVRKVYDYEARKIYTATYINGIENGLTECHYIDGNLYYRGTLINGQKYGSYYFYEKDGRLLEYDYYISGGVAYRWEYDTDGKRIGSKGSALVQYRLDSDSAIVATHFPMEIDLALPIGCISSITSVSTYNNAEMEFKSENSTNDTRSMTYDYFSTRIGADTVLFKWMVTEVETNFRDSGEVIVPITVKSPN